MCEGERGFGACPRSALGDRGLRTPPSSPRPLASSEERRAAGRGAEKGVPARLNLRIRPRVFAEGRRDLLAEADEEASALLEELLEQDRLERRVQLVP